MLTDPFSAHAEAVRTLRTNIEFTNLQTRARMIMVTSAVEQEGKSTTAANLAIAFARAGARVILVDLDLRRPFLHRFFDHHSRPGITDVVLGQVELADALFEVPVSVTGPTPRSRIRWRRPQAAPEAQTHSLGVLPAGQLPPNPGDLVGSHALAEILADVREQADVVIVDSPPLLHVSDAVTLSNVMDAMIIVSRMDVARRDMLSEVHRLLAICPTVKLGFVLTGADREESAYGYGGYYYRTHADDDPRLTAR
jgi:Mrp family chromosome partitioning ATPase